VAQPVQDAAPHGGVPVPAPPTGLSEFLGRVLDQLSLTAWLPAAMLVGNLAVLLQLRALPTAGVGDALTALTDKPLGVLVVLLFALVLAALVTQSMEFSAIRLLEGYWGHSRVGTALGSWRIRRHCRRRRRLLDKGDAVQRKAFAAARERLLDLPGADPVLVAAVEAGARGGDTSAFPSDVLERAGLVDWQEDAPAGLLRKMSAVDESFAGYPANHRVLPTRLGNTLRSAEDALVNVGGGALRGYVIRNLHRIPPAVLQEHDQYRNRLDMYCMFVVVCGALAVAAPALLLSHADPAFGAGAGLGYAVLAVVGYRAAVASGRGYATTLLAIDGAITSD